MKKRVALIAAGCIAAGSVLLSGCATEVKATVPDVIQVQNLEEDRKISLSTSETVKERLTWPGSVYGIATEDADAEKCQQVNAEKLNGLLEYLKGQGVAETSIATSDFSLNPMYDWSGNTRKLVGYEMRTQVEVSNVALDQVGSLLSQGVAAGANEIQSISYYSSTYDEAYADALARAVERAKTRASVLAEASGQELGYVINIEEYGDRQEGRYVTSNMSMKSAPGAGAAEEAVMVYGRHAGRDGGDGQHSHRVCPASEAIKLWTSGSVSCIISDTKWGMSSWRYPGFITGKGDCQ